MVFKKNIIIIGSTGRNSGKTEFACRLINKLAHKYPVWALKVVCYDSNDCICHKESGNCNEIPFSGPYEITHEFSTDTNKDTSKMINAGADESYLLMVRKEFLLEGFHAFHSLMPPDTFLVVESNSLRTVLEPGLFLIIKNHNDQFIKKSCSEVLNYADKVIDFHEFTWSVFPESIFIENYQWHLCENATAIVLAGGKSSRMEGNEKSMLQVDGLPLIQQIVNQLDNHFCQIIIGANNIEKYNFLNKRVVPDLKTDLGPLMGILSCLKVSKSKLNFITACDIPQMNLKLIKKMLNIADGYDIVMPVTDNDKYEPLFAVYNKSVIPFAEGILKEGKRKIIDLIDKVNVKFVNFENNEWYFNLNKKSDYFEYIYTKGCSKCQKGKY